MEIVVMSSPRDYPNEVGEVVRMFEMGLQRYHIRKPRLTKKELDHFIAAFPTKYRNRIILHSYHTLADKYRLGGIHLGRKHRKRGRLYHLRIRLKRLFNKDLIVTRTFHKLSDLQNDRRRYSYAFLSPVFDSITHHTLSAGFSKRALLIVNASSRQPVYAMGGVTVDRLPDIFEFGFGGAVALGAIWTGESSPFLVFRDFQVAVEGLSS